VDNDQVEVRRSKRRRRTVSAYRDGDKVIVLIPASTPRSQERELVEEMVQRLDRTDPRQKPSDEALAQRAQTLAEKYLPERLEPYSIRWVRNQNTRWGSCTPADRSIRISHRLQLMPQYVVDYVVLHELAHLVVPDHSASFKELMAVYKDQAKAQGFLEGWSAASS
jgi:hypothetical protein